MEIYDWDEFVKRVQDKYTASELVDILDITVEELMHSELYDIIRPRIEENADDFRDLVDEWEDE